MSGVVSASEQLTVVKVRDLLGRISRKGQGRYNRPLVGRDEAGEGDGVLIRIE